MHRSFFLPTLLVLLTFAGVAGPLGAQPVLDASPPFESAEGNLPPGSVMKQAILTLADGTQETIDYALTPDGTAVMGGDILITVDENDRAWIAKEQERLWAEGAHLLPAEDGEGQNDATGINGASFRWSNNTVPFRIEVGTAIQRGWVEDAMDHIEARTHVRFIPRTTEQDYVAFVNTPNVCQSPVGRQGGRQVIQLDANGCRFGQIVHEIGHSLGLWHEQSRQDRDNFVTVHWNNIPSNRRHNFNKQSGFWRCPFDFGSIMNYGSFDFAINPLLPTLTRLDGSTWVANRTALSNCDSTGIGDMYKRIRPTIHVECYGYALECSFWASTSYGVRPVTSYDWIIDSQFSTITRTGSGFTQRFPNAGTYYVFLDVIDSQGDRGSAMRVIEVGECTGFFCEDEGPIGFN